jgi:hypothetical protein
MGGGHEDFSIHAESIPLPIIVAVIRRRAAWYAQSSAA